MKNHAIKPLAFEMAKSKNPYIKLLQTNVDEFVSKFGKKPTKVLMPTPMLLSLIGDLPKEEQQLFWISNTKKISGMEVCLSPNGNLCIS